MLPVYLDQSSTDPSPLSSAFPLSAESHIFRCHHPQYHSPLKTVSDIPDHCPVSTMFTPWRSRRDWRQVPAYCGAAQSVRSSLPPTRLTATIPCVQVYRCTGVQQVATGTTQRPHFYGESGAANQPWRGWWLLLEIGSCVQAERWRLPGAPLPSTTDHYPLPGGQITSHFVIVLLEHLEIR